MVMPYRQMKRRGGKPLCVIGHTQGKWLTSLYLRKNFPTIWRPNTDAMKVSDRTKTTTGSLIMKEEVSQRKFSRSYLSEKRSKYIHTKAGRVIWVDAHHAWSTTTGNSPTGSIAVWTRGNASPTRINISQFYNQHLKRSRLSDQSLKQRLKTTRFNLFQRLQLSPLEPKDIISFILDSKTRKILATRYDILW